MKILVTGANGLLGRALVPQLLAIQDAVIIATGKGADRGNVKEERYSYHALDITDGVAANALYKSLKPDVIIHAAAMSNVDECEENKVGCWNVNVTATRFLIDAAKEFSPYIIYVSTDFIFDGLDGPYTEDATPSPVNYYGSSKRAAEKAVMESGLASAIVRTCLVYGDVQEGMRDTIISRVKRQLTDGKKMAVVDDQWRTPTYVADLAKGITLLVTQRRQGIYNISGKEMLTPYAIALATAKYFGLDTALIEKADQSNFRQAAQRPLRTGFIIDKAMNELDYQPLSFAEGLQSMLP